jgi:hypothetical protein
VEELEILEVEAWTYQELAFQKAYLLALLEPLELLAVSSFQELEILATLVSLEAFQVSVIL